jgi:hypothetical protein
MNLGLYLKFDICIIFKIASDLNGAEVKPKKEGEKAEPPTHATTDLGIRFDLKTVLYLGLCGKSENRA